MIFVSMALSMIGMLLLAACAPMAPPEPVTIVKEVDRIIQVRCEDKRGPRPDYPDTNDKLGMIKEGDIFGLAQAYKAGKTLREAREVENDAQIMACAQ